MRLPILNTIRKQKTFMYQFLGYNHNLVQTGASTAGSGNGAIEFFDMKNMSLDHYPVIASRLGEADKAAFSGRPNGLHEYKQDTLMAVCGNILYVGITENSDGTVVASSSSLLSDSEKSFATIGAYTVIMPDRVIYNAETGELTPIVKTYAGDTFGSQYLVMRMIPCDIEGEAITYTASSTAPETTTNYWYDTENNCYKKYSTSSESWIEVETPYLKLIPAISSDDDSYVEPSGDLDEEASELLAEISKYFGGLRVLDTVTLAAENDPDAEDFFDYHVYGMGKTDDINFLVINNANNIQTAVTGFTVKTNCPVLEHLCSLNNRVWGVDNTNHEIFACKLGDPTQWYNYAGIASDSYAVSLGSADEVTASAAYKNYIHFFTEDKIIKIYGDYPSNYQMYTTKADGVISGGADTVVQVEGILFWVSPIGVVSYDGSLPVYRSQKFAPNYLTGKTVAAGRDGTKYCLSVSEGGNSDGVYIYDTLYGLWTKGGDQTFAKCAELENALCFLNLKSRLITLYNRNRINDFVSKIGDNEFVLEGRTQAAI